MALPDWAEFVDVGSGRVLLDDAPPIDVRGLDVLGQGAGEEGDVDRLGEVAFDYFASGSRPVPVVPSGGVQLPLPPPVRPPAVSLPPVRALRLVSAPDPEPEVEDGDGVDAGRVSLFGDDDPDDEEDDDDD